MPYQDTGVFPIREDPGILLFCSLNRSEACIAPLKLMLPRGRSPAGMLLGIVKVVGHNIRQQAIPFDLPNEPAGVEVIGDVGGVLCQQITDDLADCVVPLFLERPIDAQDIFSVFIFHRAHHLSGIPG